MIFEARCQYCWGPLTATDVQKQEVMCIYCSDGAVAGLSIEDTIKRSVDLHAADGPIATAMPVTEYEETLWLIAARRPEAICDLEQRVGKSQAQVVAEFIAEFRHSLGKYAAGAGTPEERLRAVRTFIRELQEHGDLAMAMREPN